ncbi:UNVERIFIED_CONTAM: hypothetical protein GTU68_049427 [Idotea baltica]|nr:hypothetical protein [Idotea baltica]
MQSDLPKVLHAVAGAPMLVHTMRSGEGIDATRTIVVAGHGADLVEKAALDYNPDAQVVLQTEQLGTGHAVDQARAALADFDGDVFILYGDTPFITHETLQSMKDSRDSGASVVVLGFTAANAGGYGRLILADDGSLDAIVEAKDATPAQLDVDFCNSGVICAPRDVLFDLISKVGNENANGEYYLTDIVALARAAGLTCAAVSCRESETMGVNSRVDLAVAESTFQSNARHAAMINGATMTAPETVFFAYDTIIGRDVIVEPNVVLRPGAEIGDGAKVGNFVEVKNALVGEGAKLNHLSYIGDAEIGKDANIGAGTITCNYDGVFKHKTIIGERAFIGSNSALVAPVRVGDDAMTGSGSVVTNDVPDGDLALGRAKQVNKTGFALRLMNKLKAAKAAKKKD